MKSITYVLFIHEIISYSVLSNDIEFNQLRVLISIIFLQLRKIRFSIRSFD